MNIGNILNTKGNAAAVAEGRRQPQPNPIHLSCNQPNKYPSPIPTAQIMLLLPSPFRANSLQENGCTRNIDADKKSFACSHCNKAFARSSDLARHERIHSGVRPHVCDWPGCGKQFIQRSAMTVHTRLHTGEKPHTCEQCDKPFSDPSSLARHRRTHFGQLPSKRPYANCQKTFTHSTTLTSHQNHHTGAIEETATRTNAKLSMIQPPSTWPCEGAFSDTISLHATPSPSQRPAPLSRGDEWPPLLDLHGWPSDLGFLDPNGSFPPLGHDFQQIMTHHCPFAYPDSYGPPQPLGPPAPNDHQGSGNAAASPYLTAIGWGSPSTPNLSSPSAIEAYSYPDPTYGGAPLYYLDSSIGQPQDTEPDQYETQPHNHHNINNLYQDLPMSANWGSMPAEYAADALNELAFDLAVDRLPTRNGELLDHYSHLQDLDLGETRDQQQPFVVLAPFPSN